MATRKANSNRRTLWRRKCEEYFRACDEEGRRYTLAGLKLALGADEEEWSRLTGDPALRDIFQLAVARIQDSLEQREDQMALYLRRQSEYGGGRGAGAAVIQVRFGDGGSLEEYGG